MKKVVWLTVGLISLSTAALADNYPAKCVQAFGGMGHDYVCRNIGGTPTWCDVSSCHTDLSSNSYYAQVSQAETLCTDQSPVSEDGMPSSSGVIIGGIPFTPSAKSQINKNNPDACFYYDPKQLIVKWIPNDASSGHHKVV